jgi:hypothetical protein
MATTEASINVRLAGIGLGHPAAQAAIGELLADLRRAPQLPVREFETSSEGVKGGSLEILVTLGTSGAIASLVQIVKLWLTRDRRRSLVISVRNSADGVDINIEGEQISVAALTQALASTAKLDRTADKDEV